MRIPWLTLTLAALTVLAASVPEAYALLEFERQAILEGQWWRLLTGHFAHASSTHLLWCLAAFVILGAPAERELGRRYAGLLLAASMSVGLGLLAFAPALTWYCGLSGLDTALFARALWKEGLRARGDGDKMLLTLGFLLAACLAGKIAFEYATGGALFARTPEVPPVPAAHLLGSAAGLLWAIAVHRPMREAAA